MGVREWSGDEDDAEAETQGGGRGDVRGLWLCCCLLHNCDAFQHELRRRAR